MAAGQTFIIEKQGAGLAVTPQTSERKVKEQTALNLLPPPF